MSYYSWCIKICILTWLLASLGLKAYAQEDIANKFPTNKLRSRTEEDKKNHRPKEKRIGYIYKTNTLNTLYGNPCALDVTRRWGFEYAVEDRTGVTWRKFRTRATHNLGVKAKLFFTRGPWWKIVINKRLKDCKKKTGDATG